MLQLAAAWRAKAAPFARGLVRARGLCSLKRWPIRAAGVFQPINQGKTVMKITVPAVTAEMFANSLTNLSALLEKGLAHASARKFDPGVLLNARLAPDMFPLSRQVQLACDLAKNSVARLAALEPPRFEDNEKTIEELRARIARTIDYLKGIPASAFEGAEDRDIKVPAGPDRFLDFKGLDFVQRSAIPNVFFHITTAYAILRHNGVEIGKRDFIGGR
jgi:hypothetical protein